MKTFKILFFCSLFVFLIGLVLLILPFWDESYWTGSYTLSKEQLCEYQNLVNKNNTILVPLKVQEDVCNNTYYLEVKNSQLLPKDSLRSDIKQDRHKPENSPIRVVEEFFLGIGGVLSFFLWIPGWVKN